MVDERGTQHDEVRVPRVVPARGAGHLDPQAGRLSSASQQSITEGSYATPAVREWYFFLIQLRSALDAGVPFGEALRLVGENSRNRTIRNALAGVGRQLAEGHPIVRALDDARSIPPLIRNMLLLGLRGGNMSAAMEMVTGHYSWLLELRSLILRAIIYPSALVVLGAAIMVFRDALIASMTNKMDGAEALMVYSARYFIPLLLGAVAAVILVWLVSIPVFKGFFDRVILTAPLLGKVVHRYSVVMFLRCLAVLVEAGMPITNAWVLATQSVNNQGIANRLQPGLRFLQDGETLEMALRQTQLFSKDARGMTASGEWTGSAVNSLKRYAQWEEDQLKTRLRTFTKFIGLICMPFIVAGYFIDPVFLAVLAFLLVFARRAV